MENKKMKWVPLVLSLLILEGCKHGGQEGDGKPDGETSLETAKGESNVVTISEAGLKNMDLKTEAAALGSLNMKLKVPGRLAPDANRTAKISATLEGRLMKLNHDLGDRVAPGSVMGLVETPELLDKPLALLSPIAGIVTERSATIGELVEKGKEIFVVSDPSHLWLIGEVKEKDVALVHPGQSVDFTVLAYPGVKFQGKIARVGNAVESDSRTFEVRVEIDNGNGKLKPGMFADMEITTEVLHNALVVSDAALQTEGEDQIAFVAIAAAKFEKRIVKIGLEQEGRVQVLEGIQAGEKVVTEGSFTLKSEMLKGELGEE
jgi:multidrug efflux pump subunit AcrA (membrane-fusion protein)